MREIIKKCSQEFFTEVLAGRKKFELRLDDEDYSVGDILVLKEKDENLKLTGREVRKKITFVLKTKELKYFKKEDVERYGFVVMSLD